MEIRVHFRKDMAGIIDMGIKTATARLTRLGKPSDTFQLQGKTYILTSVTRRSLDIVARTYYRNEGFTTPQGFIACWNDMHPRNGYRPYTKVWFHTFRRII